MAFNFNLPNATSSWNEGNNWQQSSSWGTNYGGSMGTGQWASAQSVANALAANSVNTNNMAEIMAFNAAEAQKQRDWEETMSNTAHQRAVKDMIAAGLNPILAAGAQASTPQGAYASSTALQANMAREYTDYETGGSSGSQSYGEGITSGGSISNMVGQVEAIMGEVSDFVNDIKGGGNSGKGIKDTVEKIDDVFNKAKKNVEEGINSTKWNLDQNVKSIHQWFRNVLGLDK